MSLAALAVRPSIVLLVNDDPTTRESFRAALRGAGFAVIVVRDVIDALWYFDLHTPDAIVLALSLPQVKAVLAAMVERKLTQRLPVVVVVDEDAADLNPRGYFCVLVKPIAANDLVQAVRRRLPSHQPR